MSRCAALRPRPATSPTPPQVQPVNGDEFIRALHRSRKSMLAPQSYKAGPSLLAMILFEKFGQHQPLNRQAERYTREGVPLSLSTLADQVGA
jgi:transposase